MDRPRLTELNIDTLNPFITCDICHGYLRDAHAIIHCLHAFCRECIMRKIESDADCVCPKCGGLISEGGSKVFENNVKSDRSLQAFTDNVLRGLQAQTGYKIHVIPPSSISNGSSSSSSMGAGGGGSLSSSNVYHRGNGSGDPAQKRQKTSTGGSGNSSDFRGRSSTGASANQNGSSSETAADNNNPNGIEFQMTPHESETSLPPLQKPWMRTLKTTTILKLRRFLAKKFEMDPEGLEILCRNQVVPCNTATVVEGILNSLWLKQRGSSVDDFTLNYRRRKS